MQRGRVAKLPAGSQRPAERDGGVFGCSASAAALEPYDLGIPRETASAIWYRVRSGCLELSRLAFGAGQHLEVKPEGSI